MNKLIIVFFLISSVYACKKDNSAPLNLGYQYFPVNIGKYVTYDVVSIVHDDLVDVHDTSNFQIKEVIKEQYIDGEGEESNKLFRYIRANDTLPWQVKDVWIIKLNKKTAEVVEENKRRIKMAFGISYNQYWDCNALNNDYKEECYYAKIAEPFTLNNGNVIDSTAIVEHSNYLTFIDYIREYEVYAAGIGKIYAYKKDFTITNTDTLNPIKGTELFYSMIDNGIE